MFSKVSAKGMRPLASIILLLDHSLVLVVSPGQRPHGLLYVRSRTSQSPVFRSMPSGPLPPREMEQEGLWDRLSISVLPGAQRELLPKQLQCVKEEKSRLLRIHPETLLP